MRDYHNIDTPQHPSRPGKYIGYAHGHVFRVSKVGRKQWVAVDRDTGETLRAETLQELSGALDRCAARHATKGT